MRFDLFMNTLPIMLKGMLGIFAVMLVLWILIVVLGKLPDRNVKNREAGASKEGERQ